MCVCLCVCRKMVRRIQTANQLNNGTGCEFTLANIAVDPIHLSTLSLTHSLVHAANNLKQTRFEIPLPTAILVNCYSFFGVFQMCFFFSNAFLPYEYRQENHCTYVAHTAWLNNVMFQRTGNQKKSSHAHKHTHTTSDKYRTNERMNRSMFINLLLENCYHFKAHCGSIGKQTHTCP